MSDSHYNRAGNKGDVWKHFVLFNTADKLISKHVPDRPFLYVDTHCSFGRFLLERGGQWEKGIRMFYQIKSDLTKHGYFEVERRVYEESKSYLGSWEIVRSVCQLHNVPCELRLFDTSPAVAEHLQREKGFCQSDGFDAAVTSPCADLVMVDPAYNEQRERDWRRVKDVANSLLINGCAALIWYPVYVKERSVRELPGSVVAEVRWNAGGANQNMRGCGVIFVGTACDVVDGLLDDLAELAERLGGKLSLVHNVSSITDLKPQANMLA